MYQNVKYSYEFFFKSWEAPAKGLVGLMQNKQVYLFPSKKSIFKKVITRCIAKMKASGMIVANKNSQIMILKM